MAVAAAVVAVVGAVVSTIAETQGIQAQAKARAKTGERELGVARRQTRRDIGAQAVQAGGTGLLGASFTDVFDTQAIEDANFLGGIRQQIEFDIEALDREQKSAAVSGVFKAISAGLGGAGQAQGQKAAVASANRAAGAPPPRTGRGASDRQGRRHGAVGRSLLLR